MYKLFPDKEVCCKKIHIPRRDGKNIPALVVSPKLRIKNAPGILWIHGGGYMTGMKEMVHMSRAVELVKKYGATVISPGYRLSFVKPFPAAVEDCYDALLHLKNYAEDFGINKNQIMGKFGIQEEITLRGIYICEKMQRKKYLLMLHQRDKQIIQNCLRHIHLLEMGNHFMQKHVHI